LKRFFAITLASLGLTALLVSVSSNTPFVRFNPKGKKIVFIGDSLTAGYGWGWQSVMAKIYGFIEVNLSKSSKTTGWMLQTLQKYLTTDSCDAVFIYGGTNDAYSGIPNADAIKNIQAMVNLCRSKYILTYVVIGYDPMKVSYGRVSSTKATKTYVELQRMMKSVKNAKIIPVWTSCSKLDASDGLHLSASAQKRFGEYVGKEAFGE
jgi:lysophospholipase L1-like esterase